MRHAAGKTTERFHALDLRLRRTCIVELRLCGDALGLVSREHREARRSRIAADRVHRRACPKATAVAAQAPALALETAAPRSVVEHTLGLAGGTVLARVESSVRAAQDLLARIPHDAFGAGVPARHPAVGIEQEDRVIEYTVEKQAERAGVDRGRDERH